MSKYIQITFSAITDEQKDIFIATLSDSGYEGFEENENELKAFIAEENFDIVFINELAKANQLSFIQKEIKEENWNNVWESNFHPVIIHDFVAVRAHFHPPITTVKHEIIITPKMSFGTGHHATTSMMMQQMKEIDFNGKTVFDFGTGTGILAILAQKLGAVAVTAIDNDDWCIENARENFQKNNCTAIDLKKADTPLREQSFDVILANITKNIILENFPLLVQKLNKNGILLLSGLLAEDEPDILDQSRKYALVCTKMVENANWLCMRFLR